MKKLVFILAILLLVSVVGCSSSNNPVAPDTTDQIQTDAAAKVDPPNNANPPGDPGGLGDGLGGPQ